jgi:leucyl aminopeptidase
MKIEFVKAAAEGAVVAVLVHEDRALSLGAKTWDERAGGAVTRAVASPRFTGGKGQSLSLHAPAGVSAPQIVLIGAGVAADLDASSVEAAAAQAFLAVRLSGFETLAVDASGLTADQAAHAGLAARLAAYRFDKYLTKEKPEKKPSITTVQVVTEDVAAAQAAYGDLDKIADGVEFTRDLVSEPANVLFPEEFARRCQALAKLGLEVEVLDEPAMAKLGMHMLLGVGQGSRKESRLVILRWNGAADKSAQPIAFVGKGVTFDTGGISIKPAEGMEDMKWDMGGAGAVAGLMCALAGRKAKANVVGILGLVENMPDGDAQRPGDIVVSMSGQTVEVLNTDAEGRLVLGDALWYCQDRFKPKFMVDLATLTGAIIISLGNDYSGLFCNDETLSENLLGASKATGENLWRMPLPPQYDKQIDSPAADMKNIGTRAGGSITAALFLQRFTNGVPWAHLDIAGTAWQKDSKNPTAPNGASGFGVRLLDRMVADKYED